MVKPASRVGALVYSLLYKGWQAGAGLIGIALVARHFDPTHQGFYYAFASLIALQSFLDLGLYQVVSVSASHEWSRLRLAEDGSIAGEVDARSRLVSLGRFLFRWYGIAALIFWAAVSLIGLHFFARAGADAVQWRGPWLLHTLFSAGLLWLTPFLSLLEGCDQYAVTSRFRLTQSMASLLVFWFAVIGGAGLWSVALMSGVSFAALLHHLLHHRRAFFSAFRQPPASARLSWCHDLLPMQWRLAVQGLFTYLSFPLYTTLTFSRLGPVEGGRVGMTLQVISAIQSLAVVFIATRAPHLAIHAADREHAQVDVVWRRAAAAALGAMLAMLLVFMPLLEIATRNAWPLADRLLSPSATALLAAAAVLTLAVQCMAFYIRAHKQERLTWVGVISGALYGLCAWGIVDRAGASGIALTHLAVTAAVTFSLTCIIFVSCRREWLAVPAQPAP